MRDPLSGPQCAIAWSPSVALVSSSVCRNVDRGKPTAPFPRMSANVNGGSVTAACDASAAQEVRRRWECGDWAQPVLGMKGDALRPHLPKIVQRPL
jgi:hypothetical protein